MLVGVVLRHAALIAEARGFAPLLLLDEPAVHLDPDRRAALFAALPEPTGGSISRSSVTAPRGDPSGR